MIPKKENQGQYPERYAPLDHKDAFGYQIKLLKNKDTDEHYLEEIKKE
ncbi:MAG: hypothetical protein LBJ31_02655 [Treponema sp.]|jgi:hypothetical protein|nr:hypothetical protein [Treponema sp.]